MAQIKNHYAVNEERLYTTCLVYNSLSPYFQRILKDNTPTPETQQILRSIALTTLLPKLQCLLAQARKRAEIRKRLIDLMT